MKNWEFDKEAPQNFGLERERQGSSKDQSSGEKPTQSKTNFSFCLSIDQVSAPKMGVTVYRQFGKAVLRNRFKRLAREAFRLLRPQLYPHLEMNLIARKGLKEFTLQDIIQDLLTFNASL